MNEFLLFAFVIVYWVIRRGTPTIEASNDRQDHENDDASHPAGER
jgi:hypothetical protein